MFVLWGPRFKWESLEWCKEKTKEIFQKWVSNQIMTSDIKMEIEHAKVESLKKKRDYIVQREAFLKQQLGEAKKGNILSTCMEVHNVARYGPCGPVHEERKAIDRDRQFH